jgi:hypothetical protein
MIRMVISAVLLCAGSLLAQETQPSGELLGTVVDANGGAIANAMVVVERVVPTSGPLNLPSVYPEWGKKVQSDASGAFKIEGVNPEAKYRVVIAAEGHRPAWLPLEVGVDGELKMEDLSDGRNDETHQVKGHVVDAQGKPVAGAIVRRSSTEGEDVDSVAVTDQQGNFLLTGTSNIVADLRISGPTFAAINVPKQKSGEAHEYKVTEGVTLKGKLVTDGKPVGWVTVGAMPMDVNSPSWSGEREAVTNEQGAYEFAHLSPHDEYRVYTKMKSVGELGAGMTMKQVPTGDDGQVIETEAEALVPTVTVSGVVKMPEGESVPEHLRATLKRDLAIDSISVIVGEDKKFTLVGVPVNETVLLTVRGTGTQSGWHLSAENASLDHSHPWALLGKVTGNVQGLEVLLEAGDFPGAKPDPEKVKKLKEMPLRGVEGEKK